MYPSAVTNCLLPVKSGASSIKAYLGMVVLDTTQNFDFMSVKSQNPERLPISVLQRSYASRCRHGCFGLNNNPIPLWCLGWIDRLYYYEYTKN